MKLKITRSPAPCASSVSRLGMTFYLSLPPGQHAAGACVVVSPDNGEVMPRNGTDNRSTSVATKRSENFPVASFFVRPDARPLMRAFYAFAREADDVADDPGLAKDAKRALLDRFERGLDGEPSGAAPGLALRGALAAVGRDSSAGHARSLLEAFRLDVEKDRYRSWTELRDYCRLSANPVGRFILDIHDEAPDTHEPADALCTALQVINHLQDLKEDYLRLDRIYLPLDWLEGSDGSENDLRGTSATPALRAVIDRALAETAKLLDRAALLPDRLRSLRLAAEVGMMLSLANRLHQRLEREDPLARRVAPSRLDFARGAVSGLREPFRPVRRLRRARVVDGSA
jgi:hydroxysqualene synthase